MHVWLRRPHLFLLLLSGSSLVPVLFLSVLHLAAGEPWTWSRFLLRWGLTIAILVLAILTRPIQMRGTCWQWGGAMWLVVGGAAGLVLLLTQSRAAGLIFTGIWWLITLHLHDILPATRPWYRRWIWRAVLVFSAGAWPIALAQLESRFADEEFFVALEVIGLSIFWLLLLGGYRFIQRRVSAHVNGGAHFDRRMVALVFLLAAYGGTMLVFHAYRHSFYSDQVPSYPGVSEATPFICGESSHVPQTYQGADVFNRIVARVSANPNKGTPEYGMLALATGEYAWAEKFRAAILQEAEEGRYTGPAQSVKAGQFIAALRAYYYPRVRARFPDLFSEQDVDRLERWFAAINRRSMTTEWVDVLYAVAFSKWPEGLYENQESGAGLLALLEREGLADASLSAANRDYLDRNPRGWLERFRVTDDAVIYHPEWIYNAYFQYLYTGQLNEENARHAFDWMLLQALPDGAPLRYNHPTRRSWAGVAYLGAHLFREPRYLWLAGRAAEYLERSDGFLFAQIGVEAPLAMDGHAPRVGSCLLYGDSGLPNQRGPLAPDKIVLRDGWEHDSLYLLMNLRFTGWHRYKATGTLSLVYRNAPLLAEVLEGEPFRWLPAGRRLFRDKRIPRENLNGLVVEKTGMAAAIYWLTGLGGVWAQDPPHYAEVVAFETGADWDRAHIRLRGWRGWQHDRQISIQRTGRPRVVITDTVQGPPNGQAGLVWHLMDAEQDAEGFRLGSAAAMMTMRLQPSDGQGRIEIHPLTARPSGLSIMYRGTARLHTVTVFEGEP